MKHTLDIAGKGDGTEKEGKWLQILAIILGSMTAFTAGLLFAWCSPSILQIIDDKETYDINIEEASYFTVLPPVAMLSSSFVFSKMIDMVGRKYTLLFMAIPHMASWILIAAARSVWVFYISRVLTGIADSCLFTCLPVYIGEIATPEVRGTWGNCMTFFIYFGQFSVNVLGRYFNVRETAYICLVIPIIFFCTFIFMPESPYYLIMKNRIDEARTALRRFRRKENVEEELQTMQKDVERQLSESGTWKDLFTIPSNRKALYAGIFLRASQQLAGTAAFAVYTQYIFEKSGGNIDSSTCAIILTGLNTVMNFCAGFTLEKMGRKKSYLYSLLSCAIMLTLEATYLYLDEYQPSVDLYYLNWFPITGMIVFIIFYSFGLGIVPTLMLGELFSTSIKGKGLCVLNLVFGVNVASVTKIFQLLAENFGLFAPFLMFAICCFTCTFLSRYFVPETKGKTLEQIQQSLKAGKRKKDVASVERY